jgi:hypothetical protein
MLDPAYLVVEFVGTGNAPGCGAGGPSSDLRVGVGWTGAYRWVAPVGAGAATAPGFAAGYEDVVDGADVVVVIFELGALKLGCTGGAAVWGVVPEALEGLIGLAV